jgi:hypothetical protein
MNNIELLLDWLKVNLFFEFLLFGGLLCKRNMGVVFQAKTTNSSLPNFYQEQQNGCICLCTCFNTNPSRRR